MPQDWMRNDPVAPHYGQNLPIALIKSQQSGGGFSAYRHGPANDRLPDEESGKNLGVR
jgi:hypothetical protein